ncbi:MAG: hypothetical protein LJE70_18270, partial [Chromatiaceae bacterium]|nr:hypothetical protein [Chromatiaceae bacterium]
MRILIYGLNASPVSVGIGKYTGEMARWLAERGHQVKVICDPQISPKTQNFIVVVQEDNATQAQESRRYD